MGGWDIGMDDWMGGSVGGMPRRNEREFGANGVDGNVLSLFGRTGSGTSSSGNALINPLEGGCIGAIETRRRGFGYNRRLLRRRRGGGHGRVREQGRRQRKGVVGGGRGGGGSRQAGERVGRRKAEVGR